MFLEGDKPGNEATLGYNIDILTFCGKVDILPQGVPDAVLVLSLKASHNCRKGGRQQLTLT